MPGAQLVHKDIELFSLSDKTKQELTGSFLPGARIDGHGIRIQELSKKLMFKCLVRTLCIKILCCLVFLIQD